jgi:hypothetical protein
MISSTLYFLLIQLNYHFPYPLFKSDWFAGESHNSKNTSITLSSRNKIICTLIKKIEPKEYEGM